jgi:predicted dehydrogenase
MRRGSLSLCEEGTMKRLGLGIVGCGAISSIYLKNCTSLFGNVEVRALADVDPERAKSRAAEFGVPRVLSLPELLASEEVDIVLNLTVPKAHAEVSLAALEAGKHAYCEKPLALSLAEGERLVALAESKGLCLGSAPDTFLGAGLQTCRRLIDEGRIGEVSGATAFMLDGGPEGWHPNPAFYYQKGGGPMFDMGPYYIHALVSLMGPVAGVVGRAFKAREYRVTTSAARRGERIEVEVPTTVTGILDFASGAQGLLMTSFDCVGGTSRAPIEIYGSEGTLVVPDPNTFGGPIRMRRKGEEGFTELPLLFGYSENSRGLGLSDMADAIGEGRRPRVGPALALHALELMEGIHVSAETGTRYAMRHSCERPEPLRTGSGVGER